MQESLIIQKQTEKRDDKKDADDPLADLPFWLQGFKDNLVDRIACTRTQSRESDLEHPKKVATKSRKHSIKTHFPKDRNCDVCMRSKITKAPCRRRTCEALRRAEKFGDLIAAEHEVLNERGESRDNHLYAVVVPLNGFSLVRVKTKTSHETERSLLKFLEPSHRPKGVYADNSMEFRRACEVLSWITALQHLIYPRQNGHRTESAVRRVKKVLQVV